ncbi:MAG: septum formation family protein [Pseudonocardiales bacterium]|nr:septum formation family protein [Pseudonocardiales bacterium]
MMTGDMDQLLTAPVRVVDGDDAPPHTPSPDRPEGRSPRPSAPTGMHPVRRVVIGVVIGALTMFGVATLDTVTGAEVPVLGSFAALPAPPDEPAVIEVPAPPSTPGTCLTWSRADAADTALVDCAQPHLFEQAGTVLLGDQVALPSDTTWRQLVDERCGPVVLTYLNNTFDEQGRYRVGALKPSPSKWEQGDRELRCGLQSASRSGALYPMTGRVADSDQSAVEEPGTCLAIDGPRVGDPVACSGPHALEAVGIVDLAEQFPEGFPAVADQDAFLQPRCTEVAAQYAGGETAVADKGLTVYWNNVVEQSWAAGSTRVNCNVAALLPDRSGFAPVTGSVTGEVVVGSEVAPPATSTPTAGEPAPPTTTAPAPTDPAAPTTPPAEGEAPPPAEGELPPVEVAPVEPVAEVPVG